jgi:polar amino acid transport system substrate-binding protein
VPGRPAPRILAALALGLCTPLLTGCGPTLDSARTAYGQIAPPRGLAQPGHLTVAVPSDLPPYGFRSGGGGSQGFDVDLGRAMAIRMGVQLSLVALEPQDLPAAARGAGVDVVLGTLATSRTLAPPPPDLILQPYLRGSSAFVVKQDSAFQPRQREELCGHNVAVVAGTPQQGLLAEIAIICAGAPPQAVAVPTNTDALRSLESGQTDVYVADAATAGFDTAHHPGLMTTADRLDELRMALGLRTGDLPFTDAIIRDFFLVKSDGTYELLLQRWGMSAQNL